MKNKIILSVSLVLLIGICISGIFLNGRLFEPDIKDITSEKNYMIQNQQKIKITLFIPKAKLSDAIYSSEGQSFAENEIVVYQTDTTSIYLDKIMLSNESDTRLYFMFNCSYHLTDDGTILAPYKKNHDTSYTYEISLASKDLTDNTTTYPEAVGLRGQGPCEEFAFYISTDACKKAIGTMDISSFINQITYVRTK